jgi:hypothetical protein
MKLTLSIFLFLLISVIVNGQDFKLSEKYIMIEPEYELDSIFWMTPYEDRNPITVFIAIKPDTTKPIQEFTILELETYDGSKIFALEKTGLENIKSIVKVEFEYLACCSSIENHYFIITENDEWIKLPVINYVACDGPEPYEEYRFPAQQFGQEKTIIKTTSYPNQNFDIDSVNVIEKLIWNGKEIINN